VFAKNQLVLIVPEENPAGIERFQDLVRAERVVLGTESVPIGIYARRVLREAGKEFGNDFESRVLGHVVSEESNVRLVRAKVELGEADAAFVYRTDAARSSKVRVVPLPRELAVEANYPIGVVTRAKHVELAERFQSFVLSDVGQGILARHGFSERPR
jgi:molybdate transport system substrate-binding protein